MRTILLVDSGKVDEKGDAKSFPAGSDSAVAASASVPPKGETKLVSGDGVEVLATVLAAGFKFKFWSGWDV